MSLIPKIRFTGFTDNWEQCTLGEYISLFGGNAFKSKDEVSNGAKWLKIANVGVGYLKWDNESFLPEEYLKRFSNYVLNDGDYVMALTRPILNHNLKITEINESNILLNQRVARVDFKLNPYFGYQLLRKREIVDKIDNDLAGTDPPNLSSKTLYNIITAIPTFKEQKKIGSFFKKIDENISLHQRQLELFKEQKKGFLQKMFPKNDASKPEIRFSGFTDAWEQRKLRTIVGQISDGDWIEANHIFDEGEYRIIQTGNLGVGEYIDKINNAKYFHQNDFNEIKANEIYPGDLLISRLADPAGRTIILPNTGSRMVTAVDVAIIRPDNSLFDSNFLMSQMNSEIILHKVTKNVSGTSHKRISRKNLELVDLVIPSLEEQQKIGSFFKQLDDTIALHQRQLELLKEQKKGFLQKMFV